MSPDWYGKGSGYSRIADSRGWNTLGGFLIARFNIDYLNSVLYLTILSDSINQICNVIVILHKNNLYNMSLASDCNIPLSLTLSVVRKTIRRSTLSLAYH